MFLVAALCCSCMDLAKKRMPADDPCYDESTYRLIDTSAVYLLTEINNKPYFLNAKLDTVSVKSLEKQLKFYKNGKVVETAKGFEDEAEGTYCINSRKAEIKLKYRHVQTGRFVSKQKVEIKHDTLLTYTFPSPQTKGIYKTYIKKKEG